MQSLSIHAYDIAHNLDTDRDRCFGGIQPPLIMEHFIKYAFHMLLTENMIKVYHFYILFIIIIIKHRHL